MKAALISKIKFFINKRAFFKNVIVLTSGTALGQGLLFLTTPILTRLYTPADFGLLAAYSSILIMLTVIASLKYELAIPLVEDEILATNLLVLSIIIVFCMSIFFCFALLLLGDNMANLINQPTFMKYLWLVPVGVLGAGSYQVLNYWAVRKKEFKSIAKARFVQSIVQVLSQLCLGLLKIGPLGLIIGDLMGRTSGSGSLAIIVKKYDLKNVKNISFKEIKSVSIRYYKFPLISSCSALINTAGLQVPSLLLIYIYNSDVAGWFVLGQKIIGAPLSMIGQAVSQVYISEASRIYKVSSYALKKLFISTAKKLLFFGVIPIVILVYYGPAIFNIIFGSEWYEAGEYMKLLIVMYVVQFVVVPVSQTLNILERQELQFAWDVLRFIAVALVFLIAYLFKWSPSQAVFAYGAAMCITYALLFIVSYRVIAKVCACKRTVARRKMVF